MVEVNEQLENLLEELRELKAVMQDACDKVEDLVDEVSALV